MDPPLEICTDQAPFTSQSSSKQICGWILMWETTGDAPFHWRKRYYGSWILVKKFLMLDLFHLLSSPDVNWWTGVVWIIVMFLSDSHSDGTHSLQSIHFWDTDAETHFYKSDEETNSSWSQMACRRSTFSGHLIFCLSYYFNDVLMILFCCVLFVYSDFHSWLVSLQTASSHSVSSVLMLWMAVMLPFTETL